jgi:hypothetical protein
MAKDLPYFKFNVSEYINGDITLEDFYIQGVFINICAFYWFKSGNVSLSEMKRRLSKAKPKAFEKLIESNLIKVEGDVLKITFLDEQLEERAKNADKNHINGLSGGRPKKVGLGELRFYLIKCFNDLECFYKAGITTGSVRKRFSSVKAMPYQYEIILDFICEHPVALALEDTIRSKCERYDPLIKFSGHLECYKIQDSVVRIISETQSKPSGLLLETQFEPTSKPIRREERREEERREREEYTLHGSGKFFITIAKRYAYEKIQKIYSLEEYFTSTGQIISLKESRWTMFDEFVKANSGKAFNEPDHVYNTFRNFCIANAAPSQAANEFINAEVDKANLTLEAWETMYAYDLKHNEKFKNHFGYNGKLSPSQPVGSNNKR